MSRSPISPPRESASAACRDFVSAVQRGNRSWFSGNQTTLRTFAKSFGIGLLATSAFSLGTHLTRAPDLPAVASYLAPDDGRFSSSTTPPSLDNVTRLPAANLTRALGPAVTKTLHQITRDGKSSQITVILVEAQGQGDRPPTELSHFSLIDSHARPVSGSTDASQQRCLLVTTDSLQPSADIDMNRRPYWNTALADLQRAIIEHEAFHCGDISASAAHDLSAYDTYVAEVGADLFAILSEWQRSPAAGKKVAILLSAIRAADAEPTHYSAPSIEQLLAWSQTPGFASWLKSADAYQLTLQYRGLPGVLMPEAAFKLFVQSPSATAHEKKNIAEYEARQLLHALDRLGADQARDYGFTFALRQMKGSPQLTAHCVAPSKLSAVPTSTHAARYDEDASSPDCPSF